MVMGGRTHGARDTRRERQRAMRRYVLEMSRWFATRNGSQDSDSGVGSDAEALLLVSIIGRDSESGTSKKILIENVPPPLGACHL